MNAQEFFRTQVMVMKIASKISELPLDEFLENVPDAEESIEGIEELSIRSKAQKLLNTSTEVARNLAKLKPSIQAFQEFQLKEATRDGRPDDTGL